MEKADTAPSQALEDRLCLLAHDLNNDLGVIAGHCELMAEHANVDTECAERLQRILDAVHRMAKRINGHECRMVACVAQNPRPIPAGRETASSLVIKRPG